MKKVAILGASGAVGREMIADLEASALKNIEVTLFASARSAGKNLTWRGRELTIQEFRLEDFQGYDYALMSAGSDFSRQYAKPLSDKGTWVIDNSSAWRMDDSVPLVVPEVNANAIDVHRRQNAGQKIIANPNCSTIQMVVPLKALKDAYGLEMVQVATYQSVSGAGQTAIDELKASSETESKSAAVSASHEQRNSRAFNCIPAIDRLDEARHSFEEIKMVRETHKILGQSDFPVLATTVRVPVYRCHGEAVNVKLKQKVSREEVVRQFELCDYVSVDDQNSYEHFPTPRGIMGEKGIWISRIRLPWGESESDWVQFWVIADNLKKGAATNAVQILEYLEK